MVSLGKITIASGGTPQQITTNQDPQNKGKIVFTPASGNAAVVYVGLKGMSTSTGVGILGIVGKPAATGQYPALEIEIPLAPGGVMADQFWIDGTSNDAVYVGIF